MIKGGIGGANTNRGGLEFENSTDLVARIKRDLSGKYQLQDHQYAIKNIVINSSTPSYDVVRIADNKLIGIITKQNAFYNALKETTGLSNTNNKRWKPDEAFFNFETNTIFIVEKKWQQASGSVDEKMFGFVNKRRLYQRIFNHLTSEPKPTVQFSALFNSSWFLYNNGEVQVPAYQDYFDNLREDAIKIFFDNYDYWWFGL
ncbi:hypothetical protein [Paucilactobacillus wasatchensis]|uniref:Uncharacterized protein n=1 Tax=Paucilactobacillus wasatchensis TaxID=1335616 RepID=A0A0D0Y4S6_9LACO|nr:hypothetical protein [Paucilactobacillus wasatchensis]KIS03293.1 hypothetical protein WDC_1111 [Paucilactobacillus wasatchensis]